jgi:hypothetical protein
MAADKTKQLTVTISFKDEEKWLYDEIRRHSGKSTWIKDILIKEITNETYGKFESTKLSKTDDSNINVDQTMNMMKGIL